MPTNKKPYYTMEKSLFRGKVWKEYIGSTGAVPINSAQKISYKRLPPGTPPKPKVGQEQTATQKITEAKIKHPPSMQPVQPVQPVQPKAKDAEDKENLPEFDIQDIP